MPKTDPENSGGPSEITVITFAQSVRERPQMYIGSADEQGLYGLIYLAMLEAVEGFDLLNGVLAPASPANQLDVTLHPDNSVTVTDNGRGLPVAQQTGIGYEPLPEAQRILTSGFVPGYNGAATVNALSQQFRVTIWRDGRIWEQSYCRGEPISALCQTGITEKHGTSFNFLPDAEIFRVEGYDVHRLIPVMNEFLARYQDVTVTLTDERELDSATGNPRSFQFTKDF